MPAAGNGQAKAVVRIVAVDDDGQVHFTVLPGSLGKNHHLIGRAWPSRRTPTWRVLTGLITISGPVMSVPTRGFGC